MIIVAVAKDQLNDIGIFGTDQLPFGRLDDRDVFLKVRFFMDDHIFQEAIILPVFPVHFDTAAFKVTENTFRNNGRRL